MISFSAVRELKEIESVLMIEDDRKTSSQRLMQRIDNLTKYELNDDEYHLVLMLLYRFREWQHELVQLKFENILMCENGLFQSKVAQTDAKYIYIDAVDYFKEAIAKERRATGENDISKIAAKAGEDSAASVLLHFRRDKSKTPTLTNIRNVDIKQSVTDPSKEFTAFLLDWYNS